MSHKILITILNLTLLSCMSLFAQDEILDKLENKALAAEVKSWLGTPYKYGGTTKAGTDCSGFVRAVFKNTFNIELSRSSNDMINDTDKVFKSTTNMKEGDLIFFKIKSRKISHVGIYLADGYFVHSSTSRGVVISNIADDYYQKHYYKSGRIKNKRLN